MLHGNRGVKTENYGTDAETENDMTEERTVWLEGKPYTVVLSDEKEALLAARAAGRAVVGVEKCCQADGEPDSADPAMPEQHFFLPADYVAGSPDDADERFLERVLRRHLGLPWIIAETRRLLIREFTVSDAADVVREDSDREADRIFYTPERLEAYIRHQYRFYEYGIWALIDKESGRLIGKAGVSAAEEGQKGGLELGYHIFTPYRGQGYAVEACRGILDMLRNACWFGDGGGITVRARTHADNRASIRVLEKCGFAKISSDTAEQIDFLLDIRYNER